MKFTVNVLCTESEILQVVLKCLNLNPLFSSWMHFLFKNYFCIGLAELVDDIISNQAVNVISRAGLLISSSTSVLFCPGASRHRGDSDRSVQLHDQPDATVEAGPRFQQSHRVHQQESSRWRASAVFLTRWFFYLHSHCILSVLGLAVISTKQNHT